MSLDFHSLGFYKVDLVAPTVAIGAPLTNAARIVEHAHAAANKGADLVVFPELCISGYSCEDLFYKDKLLAESRQALRTIADASRKDTAARIVGLPVQIGYALYNVAAFVQGGTVHGLVPKIFVPNTHEFYEGRWFASGADLRSSWSLDSETIPVGSMLFQHGHATIGIEICEDLWAPQAPSTSLALAGATVIANPSASNAVLGKEEYRRQLVAQQSGTLHAAYCYASAGASESSKDLVYSGHLIAAYNGGVLTEDASLSLDAKSISATFDLERLAFERRHNIGFRQGKRIQKTLVDTESTLTSLSNLDAPLAKHPFVPGENDRESRNQKILRMQAMGLARRAQAAHCQSFVLGISGGLDSTLALLVACYAADILGWDRSHIHAVTMPGFGTTTRTRSNAVQLVQELGCTLKEISIDAAVRQHFEDIDHDPEQTNVVYENSQARERTQILFDLANQQNGIVVGTGDLSELALGWCTFNGDHMANYSVNTSIPKTLIRYLIATVAAQSSKTIAAILQDINDTPVSPELLPHKDDAIVQETEAVLGPYEVHDFFLYHYIRTGASLEKCLALATLAFQDQYSPEQLEQWSETFSRRFRTQQFKRTTLPPGPKIGTVSLSPRGDWRMPDEASES